MICYLVEFLIEMSLVMLVGAAIEVSCKLFRLGYEQLHVDGVVRACLCR